MEPYIGIQPLISRRSGGTLFEMAFSFAIIFILMAVFGFYASKVLLAAEGTALKSELSNLRLSVVVYRIRNGGLPKELGSIHSNRNYFVMIGRHDKEGELLDPFGSRYIYSPKDGRIRSGTPEYSSW